MFMLLLLVCTQIIIKRTRQSQKRGKKEKISNLIHSRPTSESEREIKSMLCALSLPRFSGVRILNFLW